MFSLRAVVKMGDVEFTYNEKGFDNVHALFVDFLEHMKRMVELEAKKEGHM